jgi:predicted kinase
VAEAIAAADDERLWTLLRSDVIRKELAGLAPQVSAAASYGTGLYSPELRHRTYDELFRRAETALEMGESVLLDASFSEEQQRKAARDLAARTNTELVEIECTTPPRLAMERLAARRAKGRDASDADATIYRAMLEDADPWPAARELDTSGPIGQVTATALALTGSVPPQD